MFIQNNSIQGPKVIITMNIMPRYVFIINRLGESTFMHVCHRKYSIKKTRAGKTMKTKIGTKIRVTNRK